MQQHEQDSGYDMLAEELIRPTNPPPVPPLVNEKVKDKVDLDTLFQIEKIDGEDSYRFDENPDQIAAERGQVVVYPRDNQLQIDIDSEEQLKEFWKRVDALGLFFVDVSDPDHEHADNSRVIKSKTEGHYHIYLTFTEQTFTEERRILWQSMLGSDPAREFLNFRRLLFGIERPNRLFEFDTKTEAEYERERKSALPKCKNCGRSANDHVNVMGPGGRDLPHDDYCMGKNGAERYEPLVNETCQNESSTEAAS